MALTIPLRQFDSPSLCGADRLPKTVKARRMTNETSVGMTFLRSLGDLRDSQGRELGLTLAVYAII